MKRRQIITLMGGAAAWPLVARAQQTQRSRRVVVLVPATADDPVWQARLGAFLQELALLGWTIGRNAQIDIRWGTPNATELRKQAAEIAALAPDVVLAGGGSTMEPLMEAIRTVPIVFTLGNDPVGSGYVDNLARPGGNITGFMSYEFSIAGKWLELLKEIAPGVTRVAVLRDASQPFATSLFAAMQAVAPSVGVEVLPLNLRNGGEIQRSVESFARAPNGGVIPVSSAAAVRHRDLIIALAARHKLPAVYWERLFVTAGGLMSYGPDLVDQFRQAAGYVARILKGEKPGDLPVQASTKYELAINLKAANAIGLTIPTTLVARADEVIE
jgi:putative tryptophan/tyrosine transport system substrate-binding protein